MAEAVLRVGVLCDGTMFQRWQAEAIRAVLAVPGVLPVGLVLNSAPLKGSAPLRSLLYRQYRRRLFAPKAMGPVDMTDELAHLPRFECTPKVKDGVYRFAHADLDRLRRMAPDVLLRFGFNILRGEVLELPTYGVWSFHHGDEEKYRGGPPGLWEILDGEPVIGTVLQRLTDRLDAGRILHKGWFRTVDHSLEETVDTVLMASAPWPASLCARILAGQVEAALGEDSTTNAPVRKYPGTFNLLRFLAVQARNKMRFHHRELTAHEEWNIAVLPQPIHTLLQDEHSLNVRWLPAPAIGTYRADPFGYLGPDGQLNVLYEKYDYAEGKGAVHRVRPKKDNILKRSRTMLELSGHLSYPFTITHEGEVFCVPENAETGRVSLYRVNTGNEALDHVCDLLDVPLYDPTLFRSEGRWWLFGTVAPLTNVTLMAYHANDLMGPYVPHAFNPIKQDIRSARPAGTPFVHEGQLYRPAMDCSRTYGWRVALNRISALDPFTFKEETVKFIGPLKGPYGEGLHTLSAVGDMTLLDGKRTVTSKAQQQRVRHRKTEQLRRRIISNANS